MAKNATKQMAAVLKGIIQRHNRAAAEEEPGFTCGCADCREITQALELLSAQLADAVDFIAYNDDPASGDSRQAKTVQGYSSVVLCSEVFGVSRSRIARDVVKVRRQNNV